MYCFSTVFTIIPLIASVNLTNLRKTKSQYRSHGYLFNPFESRFQKLKEGLNTVLTVISLIIKAVANLDTVLRLNTVLTVISLITLVDEELKLTFQSQYRSHGYLFNQNGGFQAHSFFCLNTVLTVISLIWTGTEIIFYIVKSQYRSHGYLFNHLLRSFRVPVSVSLNTVLTVISLIGKNAY